MKKGLVWQGPNSGRLVCAGAYESKLGWMPTTLDHLILMRSDNYTFEWLSKITLQVGENDLVVIAAAKQIVCFR